MLDEKLLHERLTQFKPEPLINYQHDPDEILEIPSSMEFPKIIDLVKTDYFDVLTCDNMTKRAEEIIRKYGVGTCGPRAFFGTTDVHLILEEKLSKFLGAEECIIYSYGFVAISSSIAAYTNKKDTVFIDTKANTAIRHGLSISKSRLVYFDHNDPESLLREAQKVKNEETNRKPSRKFLIIEGISWETGKLCPLQKFIDVAEMFKMRIFLEESYSLGILGETGRGLTEYFNIDISKIDMSFGTIEGALGSIGGYCAGSHAVIEHQRLSGSGYIFSASLPTYLVDITIRSLENLGDRPKQIAKYSKDFHHFLEKCNFEVISHPLAPFKVFRVKAMENRLEWEIKLQKMAKDENVLLDQGPRGLAINMNLVYFTDGSKLRKIHEVIQNAANAIYSKTC